MKPPGISSTLSFPVALPQDELQERRKELAELKQQRKTCSQELAEKISLSQPLAGQPHDQLLGDYIWVSTQKSWESNPKSSILIGFSIINYKPSILGYPYFWKHPYLVGKMSSSSFWLMVQDGWVRDFFFVGWHLRLLYGSSIIIMVILSISPSKLIQNRK